MNRPIRTILLTFVFLGVTAAQNPVTDWNQIAVTAALSANQAQSPGSSLAGGAGIYLAYAHLAIFEAVNAIDHRFQSYGPAIDAPAGASLEAAAIAAAYNTLLNYLPDQSSYLGMQYTASLAAIPDSSAKTDGILVGQQAAKSIVNLRSNDGRAPTSHTPIRLWPRRESGFRLLPVFLRRRFRGPVRWCPSP